MVSDPDSAACGQVCSPRANFLRWQTSGGTQGSDDLGRQTGETSVADLVQFGLNLGSGYQAAVFQNSQAVGVYANFQNATTGTGFADGFRVGIDDGENAQLMNGENTAMTFATNATERMRLDSSGNLLVGTTNSNPASSNDTGGIALRETGQVNVSRDNNPSLQLNRKTADGDIAVFQKDGTTVGSIGSEGGDSLYIQSGTTNGTGLVFTPNGSTVRPARNGVTVDATLDLGNSSRRWRDLFLSGGVYVGGTGSANYLDDYEEGTWTPAPTVGTASTVNGSYTKIGRLVHVNGYITGFSNTTNNEVLIITGLPFTGGVNSAASGSAMWQLVDIDFGYQTVYYDGSSQLRFYHTTNGGFDPIRHIDLDGSSTEVYFSATYAAT